MVCSVLPPPSSIVSKKKPNFPIANKKTNIFQESYIALHLAELCWLMLCRHNAVKMKPEKNTLCPVWLWSCFLHPPTLSSSFIFPLLCCGVCGRVSSHLSSPEGPLPYSVPPYLPHQRISLQAVTPAPPLANLFLPSHLNSFTLYL